MLTDLHEKLDPRWTALLVVDMQNDYIDDRGVLGQAGSDLSACQAIVEPVRALVDLARRVAVPVVFVRNWHSSATDSEAWLEGTHRRHPGGPRSAAAGTWGAAWYPGLEPRSGDPVVHKSRYDAFLRTGLGELLAARDVRTLVVCGTTTNVCVESTVRSAHMRDYYVVVPSDGCAAPEPEVHSASLDNIDRYFGTVTSLAEIQRSWSVHADAQPGAQVGSAPRAV